MKKIYEDIQNILSEKLTPQQMAAGKESATTVKPKPVSSSVTRVTPSGPPDGLPKKLLKGVGRLAGGLAMADFLGTHGELNTGEKEDLEARRKSDKKYQDATTQLNKPRATGYRDTSGIEYDTEGNPMRDPNKDAMATHSAITKKSPIPQASVVKKTTRKDAPVTKVDTSQQTTPGTYFPNTAQQVKPESKPESKPEQLNLIQVQNQLFLSLNQKLNLSLNQSQLNRKLNLTHRI